MSDSNSLKPIAADVQARAGMRAPTPQADGAALGAAVLRFVAWLERFGETSYDHQSYYAGPIGGAAKGLYYSRPKLGTVVVAPMVLSEAFLPSARRLFWKKQRLPIADAHYAMGLAMLSEQTGDSGYYGWAVHFLEVLLETRCPGYANCCWGYPFDWVTKTGVMVAGTPLITTTPYVYEAFESVYRVDGDVRWRETMRSIAEHAFSDIPSRRVGSGKATAGYNPTDIQGGVVNASAYRAFLLVAAAIEFGREDYLRAAEENINFVLGEQRPDGSWFYAADGERTFIDHFHTCFVLKGLAKIDALIGHEGCRRAIDAGIGYYVDELFDEFGRPKPFAKAPRLTVYRHELYDYAECISLGTLLAGRYQALDERLESTLADLLSRWQKKDGSFRSRQLRFGWDDVPMHRWGQSQVFRSLCVAWQARGKEAKVP